MAETVPSCPWCFERTAKPDKSGGWVCPCGKHFGVTDEDQREARVIEIDRHFPPCGPCAFCAYPDKRHRIIDAIAERRRAGDSLASIAEDYDLPVEAVAAAVACEAQVDYGGALHHD